MPGGAEQRGSAHLGRNPAENERILKEQINGDGEVSLGQKQNKKSQRDLEEHTSVQTDCTAAQSHSGPRWRLGLISTEQTGREQRQKGVQRPGPS